MKDNKMSQDKNRQITGRRGFLPMDVKKSLWAERVWKRLLRTRTHQGHPSSILDKLTQKTQARLP